MIVLALAVLVGIVILAEVLARGYARLAGYFVFAPRWKMKIQLDPRLHPDLPLDIRFDINAWGERGGCVPRRAYRILVTGGSACECASLDQYIAWPGALQDILTRQRSSREIADRPVHVGCTGRSGYTSTSVLKSLSKILPRYPRLDAIVIMTGASDVIRWLEIGAPCDRVPFEDTAGELYMVQPEEVRGLDPKHSGLRYLARRLSFAFKTKRVINGGATVLRVREAKRAATEIRTEIPRADIVLDSFAKNLTKILSLCKAKATRVIVVRQPWFQKSKYSPEELAFQWIGAVKNPGSKPTVFYSEQVICALYRQLDGIAARVCRDNGVEQIDLMPVLTASGNSFYDLNHFTPEGSRLVSEVVAGVILGSDRRPSRVEPIVPQERAVGALRC